MAEGPQPKDSASKGTILLLDDNLRVRELLLLILRGHGYRVFPAATRGEAHEICDQHPGEISLAIANVTVKDASAAEVIEELACHGLQVLQISGLPPDMLSEDALIQGSSFLQKPFSSRDLLDKVGQILDAQASRGLG